MSQIKNLVLCFIIICNQDSDVLCQQALGVSTTVPTISEPGATKPTPTATTTTIAPSTAGKLANQLLCGSPRNKITVYQNLSIISDTNNIVFDCKRDLNLHDCYITVFKISLPDNCNLIKLDLNHNLITDTGLHFDSVLSALKTLYLNNNEITRLSQRINFKNLPHLEILYLGNNGLTFIDPFTFIGNEKFKKMYVENNKLKRIELNLNVKHLEVIATSNPFDCNVAKEENNAKNYKVISNQEECPKPKKNTTKIVYYVIPPFICVLALILIIYVYRMLKNSDKPPSIKKRPQGGQYIDIKTSKHSTTESPRSPKPKIIESTPSRPAINANPEGYITILDDKATYNSDNTNSLEDPSYATLVPGNSKQKVEAPYLTMIPENIEGAEKSPYITIVPENNNKQEKENPYDTLVFNKRRVNNVKPNK